MRLRSDGREPISGFAKKRTKLEKRHGAKLIVGPRRCDTIVQMPPEAGRRLGPYEIRRLIGSGGMGTVYEAFDTRLRRSVAIKILREHLTSTTSRTRFEREGQSVAALSHPNVISIFDIGAQDDAIYIVSELLEGMTLREALSNGALSPDAAVDYARQAAAGLQAAHAKGIIHRDIKPENLFITRDGRLKVLDFGLARAAEQVQAITAVRGEQLTAPDTILGTITYMSPEQVRGEPVDARTDIFSLGCVMFEMLTGSPPFARATPTATLAAILEEEPSSDALATMPPHLAAIVRRCLARDRNARYESAAELIADLDRHKTTHPRGRGLLIAAVVTVAVVLAGATAWRAAHRVVAPKTVDMPSAPKRRTMLAVLPFENLSADPDQEYFSDGLTEETITQFAQLSPEQLAVIARSSTMHYKGVRADIRTIARQLGADYLVEGSVRRAGNRMRVSAELVRGTDGTEIWARSYDRTVDDLLAMQAELARGVAAAVELKVSPSRIVSSPNALPSNGPAREAYLRGRYYLHLGTAANRNKAVESMQQAVALDPTSAIAHAGLASALINESTLDVPPKDIIEKARASVQRALQLDDSIAEAHEVLGEILLEYDWKWDAAEAELQHALAIDPNVPNGHLDYATLLITSGRFAQGLEESNRGRELDPVSAETNRDGLFNLFCTRRYDEAYDRARHAIDLEPRNDFAYSIIGIVELARGRRDAALAAADRVFELKGTQTARSIAAYVYANAGRQNDARTALHNIEAESREKFACFFNVAALYTALGENDHAIASLDRAYKDRTA